MMSLKSVISLLALCVFVFSNENEGAGEIRLRKLKERSEASGGIIKFNAQDYKYLSNNEANSLCSTLDLTIW